MTPTWSTRLRAFAFSSIRTSPHGGKPARTRPPLAATMPAPAVCRRSGGLLAQVAKDRSGAVAVVIAFATTALLGFAGLATEGGRWYVTKRTIQGATDSAAYSAAIVKNTGATSSTFRREGKSVAGSYGYVDGTAGVTVAVNNPPTSGNFTTNNFAVEVIIGQPQTPFLSGLFLASAPTIVARSVALLDTSPDCIYSLNPIASGSLHLDEGGTLSSSCGIVVNSNSSTAITNSGTINAPSVQIVGGYTGVINPSPKTGIRPKSDPLAYVPAPSVGACDHATQVSASSGNVTLTPGVYCGGIKLSGSANVTLQAGTYILKGGGLDVSGSATLTGSGVTFYNTGDASHPYAPITASDQPVISLSVPTSGPLVFFQDRSIVSSLPNVLMGSLAGALYFPTTPIELYSGSSVAVPYTILVADTVKIFLNALTVTSNYSAQAHGSPIKAAILVE